MEKRKQHIEIRQDRIDGSQFLIENIRSLGKSPEKLTYSIPLCCNTLRKMERLKTHVQNPTFSCLQQIKLFLHSKESFLSYVKIFKSIFCQVHYPQYPWHWYIFTYTFTIKYQPIHVGKYTYHRPMDGPWVICQTEDVQNRRLGRRPATFPAMKPLVPGCTGTLGRCWSQGSSRRLTAR